MQPTHAQANTSDDPEQLEDIDSWLESLPIEVFETRRQYEDLGDESYPYFWVKRKDGMSWEKDARYEVHLYERATGKYVWPSNTMWKDRESSFRMMRFADTGTHEYVVILSKSSDNSRYEAPENLKDFDRNKAIGKSAPIIWERKDKINLSISDRDDSATFVGFDAETNTFINGITHRMYLYNLNTGEYQRRSSNYPEPVHYLGRARLGSDKETRYRVLLLDEEDARYLSEESGTYTYRDYNEVLPHAVIASNIVTVIRKPWSVTVNPIQSETNPEKTLMDVKIQGGTGPYNTYIVENSTGEIIEREYSRSTGRVFDNRGNEDTSWVTAYVAEEYKEGTTQRPQHFNELHGIIASSDGKYRDVPTGVFDEEEVSGGTNPSEICNMRCTGDPVNNATGEFFDKKEDITTVGNGLIPSVTRHFSTIRKDEENSLGNGWRTNYEMRIEAADDDSDSPVALNDAEELHISNENGSLTRFYKTGDTSYRHLKTNILATLEYNEETQEFEYTRTRDKETFRFDTAGKLQSITNDKNHVVNLEYNSDILTKVSDTVGNELSFVYNENNLLESITAQNGQLVEYFYDEQQLVKVIDENGIEFHYTYDAENRIVEVPNELGGVFTNTYDEKNRVIEQTDPLGRTIQFDYTGDLTDGATVLTYPNGKKIQETYVDGQLSRLVENHGEEETLEWRYYYDIHGNTVSTVAPDLSSTSGFYDHRGNQIEAIDAVGNTTYFEYDERDNLVKATDALGNETVNVYDEQNNLVSTTTPLGEQTTFEYDNRGNLKKTIDARGNQSDANPEDFASDFTYLENGLLKTHEDALGGTTSASYNELGEAVSTTDALGNVSTIAHDQFGNPSLITDPLQNETALTHDAMGNVLASENAIGAVTTYTYDTLGNLLTMTNAMGDTTTYTYTSMDKLETITYPDGSTESFEYDIFDREIAVTDGLDNTAQFELDKQGNITAIIDPSDNRTEYTYDLNGNVTSEKDATGGVTIYEYDAVGRVVSATDPMDNKTTTSYDANGRVAEVNYPNDTTTKNKYDAVGNLVKTIDEDGNSKVYEYDALNRMISYTNETGDTVQYTYDAASNLVESKRADGSVVQYSYDERGLLMSVEYEDNVSNVEYTYDEIGRKVSETKGGESPYLYEYDALNRLVSQGQVGKEVSYTYDVVDNLVSTTYPSGRVVEYDYDAADNVQSLATDGVSISSMQYNPQNQLQQYTLSGHESSSIEYDPAGRVAGKHIGADSKADSVYSRMFEYNAAGEITHRGSFQQGEEITSNTFEYNAMSQLVGQHAEDATPEYEYDYNATGNILDFAGSAQNYDNAGRITASGDTVFSYDDRGNRVASTTSQNDNDEATEDYTWSQDNLLRQADIDAGDTKDSVSYTYGAENLVASRTRDDTTQEFIWDTNRAIPVLLSDGEYEYIYQSAEDRVPMAQVHIATQVVEYLHTDSNGSVIATTDSAGELIGTVEYSPYGEPTSEPLSAFGYAGEWTDDATGHVYLRARWLDVETGTFLSEDPLVQITMNAYGYTEGNPLTQIDPLGLFTWNDFRSWITDDTTIEVFSNISSVTGGIAAVAATVSVFVPVAAPIAAPIASVSGTVSLASSTISTIGNCIGVSNDECTSSMVSTGISAIPATKPFSKRIKNLGNEARAKVQKGVLKPSRSNFSNIDTSIVPKRFAYSGIHLTSPATDVFTRFHSDRSRGGNIKGVNEC